jgi:hypothetical protein
MLTSIDRGVSRERMSVPLLYRRHRQGEGVLRREHH